MKIFIAGHNGLVGSAFFREAHRREGFDIITAQRDELELTNTDSVKSFLKEKNPDLVVIAAAKVGGIMANASYPTEFMLENLKIQNNLIEGSFESGVKKLIFLASNCFYPKQSPQPFKEDSILTGPLEPTNEPYALAKIIGARLCEYYNRQFGTQYITLVPASMFGSNDNYNPQQSHVLPALIRRFHEAKENGAEKMTLWGTGTPKREVMYSDDFAKIALDLIDLPKDKVPSIINIGTSQEFSIKELAESIMKEIGVNIPLEFDSNYPDGMMRKVLDSSKLTSVLDPEFTDFSTAINATYQDFLNNPSLRR